MVKLECLGCHTAASVKLSPGKFKGLSSSWKLARECRICGRTTDWSFAQAAVKAEEQADFWDWLAVTGEYFEPAGAAPRNDLRREKRTEAHVPLRITTARGQTEEVISENISRGGLCFSSAKSYQAGEAIRVTIQPSGALNPQTKAATIVRVSAPLEGKTLYGARLVSEPNQS